MWRSASVISISIVTVNSAWKSLKLREHRSIQKPTNWGEMWSRLLRSHQIRRKFNERQRKEMCGHDHHSILVLNWHHRSVWNLRNLRPFSVISREKENTRLLLSLVLPQNGKVEKFSRNLPVIRCQISSSNCWPTRVYQFSLSMWLCIMSDASIFCKPIMSWNYILCYMLTISDCIWLICFLIWSGEILWDTQQAVFWWFRVRFLKSLINLPSRAISQVHLILWKKNSISHRRAAVAPTKS